MPSQTFEHIPTKLPKAQVIGESGNIFSVMGIASRALRKAKLYDSADEMASNVMSSDSYDEALSIIQKYVDVY